jgi:CheY-like chemotaxis protein
VSGVAYRALVVDDEVALAGVLSAYLRRGGFDVVEAHDGRSAVAEARRSEPDLLVLDLGLPLLDGVDVCRSVREFSDCYVIMLGLRRCCGARAASGIPGGRGRSRCGSVTWSWTCRAGG